MKSQSNPKGTGKLKHKILLILLFILFACATVPVKTYEETVSEWKSYKDVAKWMSWNFSYDMKRLEEGIEKYSYDNPMPVRTPKETFELKSGICQDAAVFAKETLNRIDASYQAEIVFIDFKDSPHHYVCSFRKDGKLYIMDYGTPTKADAGVDGPFDSLEKYEKFYETWHPWKPIIKSISFGWPDWKKDAEKIVTVIWTSVNIRSGAGNSYPVVTTVKQGAKLTLLGEHGDWLNVRSENGQEGWINGSFVKNYRPTN
jgi:hypothetical protein